ncbi:MAG: zinc ABC transporter substrate-binding protein [Bacteroidia bacterium]|nr:zinc ABC transporter substrate-binding protein [Bacteroidia bacterium]
MRKFFSILIIVFINSCGRQGTNTGAGIITVSIAPFKYFVEEIAGDDFKVNVMVPAGANPHIYEPFPEQINKLRRSAAYISNGYLGFEMTWLDRFYEINRTMKRLSLGDKIDPLVSMHHHEADHVEGADPHYWVSPKCAMIMASSVKEFLSELNPSQKQKYEANFQNLVSKIQEINKTALELFSGMQNRSFMIYHPNLGYLARDYGLEEIPVEYEGKEPPPSRMKELIDRARKDDLKTIFVQREYDTKNANAIADEIGAEVKIIDPLSENWQKATMDIINALHDSLIESSK